MANERKGLPRPELAASCGNRQPGATMGSADFSSTHSEGEVHGYCYRRNRFCKDSELEAKIIEAVLRRAGKKGDGGPPPSK